MGVAVNWTPFETWELIIGLCAAIFVGRQEVRYQRSKRTSRPKPPANTTERFTDRHRRI